jgi:4'-phosphopantetheinyl transferase
MEVLWLEQSVADVPNCDDWLSDAETSCLNGLRFPKRRSDWRLGRWTAKHAIAAYLNLSCARDALVAIEIRKAPSGAPEAFLEGESAGVGISISHRADLAACAVAPSGVMLGCDVELVEPRTPAFIADYFTPKEQAMIASAEVSECDRLAILLWSAKESALKALEVGLRFDTRSVEVSFSESTPATAVDFRKDMTRAAALDASPHIGDWRPLTVSDTNGQSFQGWWRSSSELLRTIVSIPSAGAPRVLNRVPAVSNRATPPNL